MNSNKIAIVNGPKFAGKEEEDVEEFLKAIETCKKSKVRRI